MALQIGCTEIYQPFCSCGCAPRAGAPLLLVLVALPVHKPVVTASFQQWKSQGHFRNRSQEMEMEAVVTPASATFVKGFWEDLLGSA